MYLKKCKSCEVIHLSLSFFEVQWVTKEVAH